MAGGVPAARAARRAPALRSSPLKSQSLNHDEKLRLRQRTVLGAPERLDLAARVCNYRVMIQSQGVGRYFALRILAVVMLAMTIACFFLPTRAPAAGVTIITHGLSGDVDDWVISMANQMTTYYRFPGSSSTCYKLYFTPSGTGYTLTWSRIGGIAPATTDSGEILIKLDWSQLANDSYSTRVIAPAVVSRLLQSDFISEMNGHALAELPIHLIGHSRGGSLVCEVSKLLGQNGVWVDHLTTLDPHPMNNDGFNDTPFYTVVDAPARTYENVLFHDNYYQWLNLITYGEPVAGAYVRRLTYLAGGYETVTASHSDVHLWYHGTVDSRLPANDSVVWLTSTERQTWWTPYESYGTWGGFFSGFYYSLIGGGDRMSSDQPAGTGTGRVLDGYNQKWPLGVNGANNRTSLPSNNGSWPNLIRFNIVGTNAVTQGESVALKYFFQNTQTATVTIFLDDDLNPQNGNLRQVAQYTESGHPVSEVWNHPITFSTSGITPRSYAVYARITSNGRSRYLYAPELLTIRPVPCNYSIAPAERSHPSGAGNSSVNVTAGTTCAWTATSNNDWINVTAGASGTGNGTVFYSVQLNPDLTGRTGTMTVAGSTFTVVQAGLPPDITRPTVSITGPLPTALFTDAHVILTGLASDDRGLARVEYQFGTNDVMVADGTNSWTATLELLPGTNTVRVWSRDLTGNISTTNTRSFYYSRVPLAKGAYNGLFHEADGFRFGTSGSFKLVVTGKSAYSGSLVSGGKAYSVSGKFNPDGTATNLVVRRGTNALLVTWMLDLGSLDNVTGTVNGGNWEADLSGDRAVYNAKTNPARQAGKFTFTIAGQPGATGEPEGDGFGTAIVDGNGKVKVSGTLAEGTKFTQSATLSADGRWPLFASLYASKGAVVSWMSFDSMQTNQFGGVLNWFNPPLPASKYYTNGLGITNVVAGSRYAVPIGATNRILSITDGSVIFSGGNRLASITNAVILGLSSKVTNASPNKLTLSFTLSSGLFSGTLIETGTVKKVVFKGAVLQSLNSGSGFFLGTNQSGRVSFQSAP